MKTFKNSISFKKQGGDLQTMSTKLPDHLLKHLYAGPETRFVYIMKMMRQVQTMLINLKLVKTQLIGLVKQH